MTQQGFIKNRTITKIVFLGSKQIGLQAIRTIHAIAPGITCAVISIDDRQDSRSVYDEFQAFSKQSGIPLEIAANRKEADALVHKYSPELCVVVGWYWLIGPEMLTAIPNGFIGIHHSKLPKYRGGAPVVWAIMNNEKEAGTSLFSFADGIDNGPIWGQGVVPINPEDDIKTVVDRLEKTAVELLQDNLPGILDGTISPTWQDETQATYCSQRYPRHGLIDWNKPANTIYNFVRANTEPYPGAFTFFKGQKIQIWKARLFDFDYYGTPGQVAQLSETGVYVICGDNKALIVEEIGVEGQRLPAHVYIKSIKTGFTAQ
jgi:methionyl-tRNA formyltransferase